MAVTPQLVPALSLAQVQLVYGGAALVAGVVFVLVARDRPAVRLGDEPASQVDPLMMVGVRRALHVRPFVAFLAVAFLGLGVFNGLSTWVEEVVRPRGFSSTDAGNLGALLLLGGLVGAVLLSALSDRTGRRVPYLVLAMVVSGPALLGVALADSHLGLLASAFVLGFFLTAAMPIGMQYSAEITAPVPEGTSNGLIQLAGQASVLVVLVMALTRTSSGSYTPSLAVLAALLVGAGIAVARLPEPEHHLALRDVLADAGGTAPP
jgi:MFS family permease